MPEQQQCVHAPTLCYVLPRFREFCARCFPPFGPCKFLALFLVAIVVPAQAPAQTPTPRSAPLITPQFQLLSNAPYASQPGYIRTGSLVTFSARLLPADATGTVTFSLNGTTLATVPVTPQTFGDAIAVGDSLSFAGYLGDPTQRLQSVLAAVLNLSQTTWAANGYTTCDIMTANVIPRGLGTATLANPLYTFQSGVNDELFYGSEWRLRRPALQPVSARRALLARPLPPRQDPRRRPRNLHPQRLLELHRRLRKLLLLRAHQHLRQRNPALHPAHLRRRGLPLVPHPGRYPRQLLRRRRWRRPLRTCIHPLPPHLRPPARLLRPAPHPRLRRHPQL